MEIAASLTQFSDRLSPVFVRELRQGLRAHSFVWAFVTFQVGALTATLLELFIFESFDGYTGVFPQIFSNLFRVLLHFGFGLLLPLTQFSALHSEIGRGRNIELVLASGLTRWQLVWGKFLVASTLSGLLLISLLPYLLLRYFLGNAELTAILGETASTYLGNMAMNAIVIGASGYTSAVGRIVTIFYFYIIYTLTVFANIQSFGSRAGTVSPVLSLLCVALGGVVVSLLALQLGRARMKLFEDPLDPPSSAGIFAIAFALPMVNGVAAGTGGALASFAVLGPLLFLVLMIDRGPGRNSRSRGLQP
ncbi:MAG: hypothetical protein P1U87_14140 [Verrucomicrobiales bacterium]|nr:hypothetical protein [Verrucomicrobiales bacterium]